MVYIYILKIIKIIEIEQNLLKQQHFYKIQ